ncbi:transposase domain-containing protein [Bradyrhizobium manausense]|nr:transposase domain-containing protein [Bradyrhizobium manausense]UVO30855.1 transposase domain-containing protein [Bradyrhizobium arachidis]
MVTIATLLRTAKINDVDLHAWLKQTLEEVAQGWPISRIDAMMPGTSKPQRTQLGAYGDPVLSSLQQECDLISLLFDIQLCRSVGKPSQLPAGKHIVWPG